MSGDKYNRAMITAIGDHFIAMKPFHLCCERCKELIPHIENKEVVKHVAAMVELFIDDKDNFDMDIDIDHHIMFNLIYTFKTNKMGKSKSFTDIILSHVPLSEGGGKCQLLAALVKRMSEDFYRNNYDAKDVNIYHANSQGVLSIETALRDKYDKGIHEHTWPLKNITDITSLEHVERFIQEEFVVSTSNREELSFAIMKYIPALIQIAKEWFEDNDEVKIYVIPTGHGLLPGQMGISITSGGSLKIRYGLEIHYADEDNERHCQNGYHFGSQSLMTLNALTAALKRMNDISIVCIVKRDMNVNVSFMCSCAKSAINSIQ